MLDRDVPERMFPDWSMAWRACPADHPATGEVRAIASRGKIMPCAGAAAPEALIASVFRSVPALRAGECQIDAASHAPL